MMSRAMTILLIAAAYSSCYGQGQYSVAYLQAVNNPSMTQQEVGETLSLHQHYIDSLFSGGSILLSGTLGSEGQVVIINTPSTTTARQWMSNDLAVSKGAFQLEIMPWTLRLGKMCKDISPSTTYFTLVRYNTQITKFNVQDSPQLLKQHEDYLNQIEATGNLVMEGYYTNSDGGMMIVKGEITDEVILADPTVKNGFIKPFLYELRSVNRITCPLH